MVIGLGVGTGSAPRSRSTALTFTSFMPTCALSLTRRRSGVCAENAGASSFTSPTLTAHRHKHRLTSVHLEPVHKQEQRGFGLERGFGFV